MQRLDANLKFIESLYGIDESTPGNPQERFRRLILELYKKFQLQVVVLVDEYEKPVLDTLDYPEISESHKSTLRGFYGVLKSMDRYLKLVFITGVTKFGQMNIFSGLNNIRDISLNRNFGAICGVTEDELTENFKEGIDFIADEYEKDYNEALALLKRKYDGYHFSRNCPDIYNPYSLINAFADGSLKSYWAFTGTPKLLADILRKKRFDLRKLDNIKTDENMLTGINNQFDDPVTLFYQTGYLTIKEYDRHHDEYILGYPNLEVEDAFFRFLLPNFSGSNPTETLSFINQFEQGLENGNPEKAMKVLEEFSAGISYDVVPDVEVERHFQYIIYITSKLLASRKDIVKVEEKTSDGRIDLLIATDNYVYVIKIKRDSSAREALNQIREKEYALQFRSDSRKVFLIGVNFSTEKKRIDGFEIF